MKLIVKIFLLLFLFIFFACEEDEDVVINKELNENSQAETIVDKSIEEEMRLEKEEEMRLEKEEEMRLEKEEEMRLEKEEEMRLEKEEEMRLEKELTEFLKNYNVPGIDDLNDLSWPREVEAMNGTITIDEKPERILTISTGHDEMIFGFANLNNIVGVTSFSQSPGGNIYELTKDMPTITSEIETIVAQNPDIVFADPYANANLMQSLVDLGITVVQTNLNNTNDGRINDILFAAYVLDELEGARMLINAIDSVVSYIYNTPINSDEYNVLSVTYYDAYWAAGEGSTEGSIIELAGFINSAAEEGVVSNNMITKESLIAMMPHHIVIPQSVEWGGQDFYDTLMSDESFSSIPAVKNESVHMVNTSHFTTLSHFNILGAIDLLEILPGERMGLDEFEKPILKACYQCFGD